MDFTIAQLKEKLQCRGLRTTGNKADLVARLQQFDEENPDFIEVSPTSERTFYGFDEGAAQNNDSQIVELQKNMTQLMEAVATLTQKIGSIEKEKNLIEITDNEVIGHTQTCTTTTSSCPITSVSLSHASPSMSHINNVRFRQDVPSLGGEQFVPLHLNAIPTYIYTCK